MHFALLARRPFPHLTALVASSLLALACSGGADESVDRARGDLKGISGPAPVGPLPVGPSCPAVLIDAHRSLHTCDDVTSPATAGGTWSVARIFPNDVPSIRDHFCTYTWQPGGYSCAAPPLADLHLAADGDSYNVREECPGAASCTPDFTTAAPTTIAFRGGGGCTACGAIAHGVAYLLLPKDETHLVVLNARAGGAPLRLEATTTDSRVVSVTLPPLEAGAYDDGLVNEVW